jgi:hypothetical protein
MQLAMAPGNTRIATTLFVHLTCALLSGISSFGCGDGDDAPAKETPMGDACLSPGLTTNDCMCANGVNGYRTCGQDRIWEACTCGAAVPEGECRAGQRLLCTCPDQTQKVIRCMPDGTYDCACEDDGGSADAASSDASATTDAASVDATIDASGDDAGH